MRFRIPTISVAFGLGLLGCAGWDNPTALAELEPQADLEIHADRVETFEELEVHARVTEGGSPMPMKTLQLEIEHALGGPARIVKMEREGDEYAANVMFYEDGEHHLHLVGMPEKHRLMRQMGEYEVEVHRQHREVGEHWVEMALAPAPVLENRQAEIRLFVYELHDGEADAAVSGLTLVAAVHTPFGREADLHIEEVEPGEYAATYGFGVAGAYELHVEIELPAADDHDGDDHHGDDHTEGEFHIRVLTSSGDDSGSDSEGSGGGHGH